MLYPAFVCYQLHAKTTDRIFMKILPEMCDKEELSTVLTTF